MLNNIIMSKFKNLSDLGDLYSTIQKASVGQPEIKTGNEHPDILLTDASQYLYNNEQQVLNEEAPKAGSALGGGPGTETKDGASVTPPSPKSGPKGLKGNNFDEKLAKSKKAEEIKQGAEETEQEEKEMEAAEKNEEAPKKEEKVSETVDSASKTPKYNKQTFTMPKSKFQQIYEDAMQKGPFVNEEEMTPIEPAADDTAEIGAEPEMGGEEEACCTHEEAIEMVEKLLKFLKKDTAYDKEHGDLGDEDQAFTGGGEEEETAPMEEAVEAEDLGHPGPGHGAKSEELKDGHKIHKVGSLKAKGKASFEGGPAGQDGAVKKQSDSAHLKDGHKIHTAGDLKVDKGQSNAFEQ